MKLATLRAEDGTRAVRVDEGVFVDLEVADVGVLLAEPNWRERAEAATKRWDPQTVRYATLVPHPSKVWCTGLNYRNHIAEVGRPTPEYPTLFVKFAESLIGAYDEIVRPPESAKLDWEGELTIVIGARVRRASEDEARAAIAGFTVMNDISCRDWQSRTLQWDQGKAWEALTPVGPVLVTPDELPGLCAGTAAHHRGRRRDDAGRRHLRPGVRSGRAGAVRLDHRHAQPGRPDRDRDPGWGWVGSHPAGVPGARTDGVGVH